MATKVGLYDETVLVVSVREPWLGRRMTLHAASVARESNEARKEDIVM